MLRRCRPRSPLRTRLVLSSVHTGIETIYLDGPLRIFSNHGDMLTIHLGITEYSRNVHFSILRTIFREGRAPEITHPKSGSTAKRSKTRTSGEHIH